MKSEPREEKERFDRTQRLSKIIGIVVAAVTAGPLLIGLVVAIVTGKISSKGHFTGRIQSTGTTGTWVLDHGACFSGERDGYFGVSLETPEDDGIQVKFTKDPTKGWIMHANMADTCKGESKHCLAKWFDEKDCATLDVGLKLDPSMKSQYFNGTAAVDCSVEGAHVFGQVTVDACRAGYGK
jgi:hypothetical protein